MIERIDYIVWRRKIAGVFMKVRNGEKTFPVIEFEKIFKNRIIPFF